MKNKKSLQAFTLIELAVVFAIIAIMATLAVNSLFGSMPRIRLRGDLWDVNQAILNARMRAISENNSFGLAFYRSPAEPYSYYYFAFKDENSDNAFTDLTGGPLVQTAVGEDPIVGGIHFLDSRHFFREVFANAADTDTQFSAGVIAVIFESPMGRPDCPNTNCGDIIIQSRVLLDSIIGNSYAARVRLDPATGNATRIPIERMLIP